MDWVTCVRLTIIYITIWVPCMIILTPSIPTASSVKLTLERTNLYMMPLRHAIWQQQNMLPRQHTICTLAAHMGRWQCPICAVTVGPGDGSRGNTHVRMRGGLASDPGQTQVCVRRFNEWNIYLPVRKFGEACNSQTTVETVMYDSPESYSTDCVSWKC